MRELLEQLRRIRFLPGARGATPPTILIGLRPDAGGDAEARERTADEVADEIYESARDTPRTHVRNRVRQRPQGKYKDTVQDVFEVAEMLREAGREISVHHADKEPEIRFLFLSRVLRLVELGEISAGELKDELRWRRRFTLIPATYDPEGDDRESKEPVFASVVEHVDMFAAAAVALLSLISLTVATIVDLTAAAIVAAFGLLLLVIHTFTYGRQMAGRWRYRWLARQPYLRARRERTGFLTLAERIGRAGRPGHTEEDGRRRRDLELLLVHAFLEDIRRAYRRNLRRRAPWARTVYPIMVLSGVTAGSATDRLLRLIDEVRRDRKVDDPLLVVAVAADPPERLEVAAPPRPLTDLGVAVQVLGDWVGRARTTERFGAQRDVVILLSPDAAGEAVSMEHLPEVPKRPLRWHRAMPPSVAAVVFAASALGIGWLNSRFCDQPDVWRADNGECVGVTDGAFPFDARLEPITDAIKQENDKIEDSGQAAVTVVYYAAMNRAGGDTQPNLLAGVQGELAGVATQQWVHNRSSRKPKIKLLLANPGARNAYAEQVADQVVEMTREDPTIVGAVGFGQSTEQMRAAVQQLTSAGLPMIGTVSTFERLSEIDEGRLSPYFFRLAPGNSRLAGHAARWAYEGDLDAPPARRALVFTDGRRDDLYSGDLGKRFAAAFKARRGTTVTTEPYFDTSDFDGKLSEACSGKRGRPQIIYYAGRADEFSTFYEELNTSTCDPADFTLLAGDDVTKYVRDNLSQLGAGEIRFYYTPLALPVENDEWRYWKFLGDVGLTRKTGVGTPSHTHAAVAHDALLMMTRAASDTYRDQRKSAPRGGALLYPLSQLTTAFGESGYIKFTGREGGHEAMAKAVLLVTVTDGGAQQLVAHCGPLVRDDLDDEDLPKDRCVKD